MKSKQMLFILIVRKDKRIKVVYSVESSDYYGTSLDYVILTVQVKKLNSSGTAVCVAEYVHATAGIGARFTYTTDKKGSITLSPSFVGSYDVMVKDIDFEY